MKKKLTAVAQKQRLPNQQSNMAQYESLRTGKVLDLTPQGAEMLNKRGMFVKYIGETENVTIQDSTPKVSGGKTKANTEPMEAPAVEGKASESEPTETI